MNSDKILFIIGIIFFFLSAIMILGDNSSDSLIISIPMGFLGLTIIIIKFISYNTTSNNNSTINKVNDNDKVSSNITTFNNLDFPKAILCYDKGQRKNQPITFGQLDFYKGELTGFIVRNDKYGTIFGGKADKILSLMFNGETYSLSTASPSLYKLCREKVNQHIQWHDFEVYFIDGVLPSLPKGFINALQRSTTAFEKAQKLAEDSSVTVERLEDIIYEVTNTLKKLENVAEGYADDQKRDRVRFIAYGISEATQTFLDKLQDRIDTLEDEQEEAAKAEEFKEQSPS